jgi:hypothetical protein
MALEDLEGKTVFSEGSRVVFVGFLTSWKLWHERTGALVKFGNFSGIFEVFGVVRLIIIFLGN